MIKKSFLINKIYKKIVNNMKTTIEINGFEIVIEEIDGLITVSAVKDEEVIEEFEIQSGAQSDDEESQEVQDFDDFEEESQDEEDSEEMGEMMPFGEEEEEDFQEEEEEEEESQEEEEEEGSKLESFQSFLKKRK
jgi:hypothetical protein